jgi:hypothetical protein
VVLKKFNYDINEIFNLFYTEGKKIFPSSENKGFLLCFTIGDRYGSVRWLKLSEFEEKLLKLIDGKKSVNAIIKETKKVWSLVPHEMIEDIIQKTIIKLSDNNIVKTIPFN